MDSCLQNEVSALTVTWKRLGFYYGMRIFAYKQRSSQFLILEIRPVGPLCDVGGGEPLFRVEAVLAGRQVPSCGMCKSLIHVGPWRLVPSVG